MKKLLTLSAILASAVCFAPPSHAQTLVGVQFAPYYSGPYNTLNGSKYGGPANIAAGVGTLNQTNWNVAISQATGFAGGNGTVSNSSNANLSTWVTNPSPGAYPNNGAYTYTEGAGMKTSTGAASTLGFTATVNVSRGNNNQGVFAGDPGNNDLASGGVSNFGGTMTLTLGGLNSGDNYNLVAYLDMDYYGTVRYNQIPPYQIVGVSLGSTPGNTTTYYVDSQPQSTLTGWQQASSTDPMNPTLGNYVEFTDISGAQLEADTLTLTNGGGLAGFQVQDTGEVPEPSTWALMLAGLGALLFYHRRRKLTLSGQA